MKELIAGETVDNDPEQFIPLFTAKFVNISFLNNQIFAHTSMAQSKVLVICRKEWWNTFIDHQGEKRCSEKGVEFFSNQEKFTEWVSEFKDYMREAKDKIIPHYSKPPLHITRDEFTKLYFFLIRYWQLYGFTEFPYTNKAYQVMTENKDILLQRNLDQMYALKVEGREILNHFFFSDGVIPNIVLYFSTKYYGDQESAKYLSYDEILRLFDQKNIDKNIIEVRKKEFALLATPHKIYELNNEECQMVISSLIVKKEADIVQGVVAHRGKAVGKVVLAPMGNTRKEVQKVFDKMEVGSVLVAQTTGPEFMVLCSKACAIVADQGGMLSHAAVVSRELGIPCIVGTNYGTQIFHDGDLVEVDAEKGVVRKIT